MINVIIFVINVTYNKKHFVIKEDKTRQSKKIGLADMWMVVVGSGCFLILLSAKVQRRFPNFLLDYILVTHLWSYGWWLWCGGCQPKVEVLSNFRL